METDSLTRLIDEFASLPGIGRKTAERLAYHVLMADRAEALKLADAIHDVKNSIRNCKECFNLSEEDLCSICKNPKRDRTIICVVEQPKDVMAIEKTGTYNGLYHVLMGHLNPLEGMNPEDLTAQVLQERVQSDELKEIVLATNPDLEGDGTALYIADILEGSGKKLTRIAKGIPAGTNIEYSSKAILQDALSGRREM